MTRESCVKHPARNPTIVLRDDYLRLMDGDYCAAMILSQHEHWHNIKLDNRQQANEHNQAAMRASEAPIQDIEFWVYMTQAAMKSQLMGMFGDKAITAGYKKILDKGFFAKRTNPKYTWDKTLQYLFMVDRVQETIDALAPSGGEGDDAGIHGSADSQGSRAQKRGLDTVELRHSERKDANSKTQKCGTLKTSSETAPKTSSENPPPQAPPGLSALEEENLNASPIGKDEAKGQGKETDVEVARVERMIEQIAKVTKTSIELEELRPLALECVRREHKDAWKHTLTFMQNKMGFDKKPLNPNRLAFTVLTNALKSPVPASKPSQAPSVPVTPVPLETLRESQVSQEPAEWARRQARQEMSGTGAAAFKHSHGRASTKDDWTARAWELQAAGNGDREACE